MVKIFLINISVRFLKALLNRRICFKILLLSTHPHAIIWLQILVNNDIIMVNLMYASKNHGIHEFSPSLNKTTLTESFSFQVPLEYTIWRF